MRMYPILIFLLASVAIISAQQQQHHHSPSKPSAQADAAPSYGRPPYISELTWRRLSSLSLEQKIGQMIQLDITTILSQTIKTKQDATTIDMSVLSDLISNYHVGSFLNSPLSQVVIAGYPGLNVSDWQTLIGTIQSECIRVDGVPMIYGIDSIHGATYVYGSTLFPQQINAAASFNTELVESMGRITAKDTRAASIPWVFAPVLDIALHSAWPRVFETFGEDPYVVTQMGAAIIKGMQGDEQDMKEGLNVAACFKHFIGYSGTLDGHDRSEVHMHNRELLQYYVPAFQSAIQLSNIKTGMVTYAAVNGVPIVSSNEMTQELLRDTLQFNGTLVTDYREIFNLYDWHHVSPSKQAAIQLCMQATSVDMAMVPQEAELFFNTMLELVNDGIIPESRIDISAARILQLKEDLGLFDNPVYPLTDDIIASVGCDDDRLVSLNLARESIVLLKNDGVLPLNFNQEQLSSAHAKHHAHPHHHQQASNKHSSSSSRPPLSSIQNILFVGPSCDSLPATSSGWTQHWQGANDNSEFAAGSTYLQAFQTIMATSHPSVQITYQKGVEFDGSFSQAEFDAAVHAAQTADIVIACIGETHYAEKPGDIDSINLPWGQQYLINSITALPQSRVDNSPKSVILILTEGRPRVLDVLNLALLRAIFFAGLPGPEGGTAMAEILLGLVNPSGKMSITYPSAASDLPLTYYHKYSQAVNYKPLFEFGSGLSYSSFQYSNLQLSSNSISSNEILNVSITVHNTGGITGKESVLLFLSDLYRIISPEVKMLKRFTKLQLQPNEQQTVEFQLYYNDFAFYGLDNEFRTEAGEFQITIGDESALFNLTDSVWQQERQQQHLSHDGPQPTHITHGKQQAAAAAAAHTSSKTTKQSSASKDMRILQDENDDLLQADKPHVSHSSSPSSPSSSSSSTSPFSFSTFAFCILSALISGMSVYYITRKSLLSSSLSTPPSPSSSIINHMSYQNDMTHVYASNSHQAMELQTLRNRESYGTL